MVITRFAPSPTGDPHIGNIRTALFAYLFARHNKGKFLLRIEDTDRKRYDKGSIQTIKDALTWLNIIPENIDNPIIQSQRLEIYKQKALQLVEEGKAYICTCSEERLKASRDEMIERGQAPMYDKSCRTKSNDFVEGKSVIRMKVPEDEKISFNDLVRGRVEFNSNTIDDQIILKSDGFPTYHLAHVIDDHEMEVTDVIRSEEWLSSTPKHILLNKALGYNQPNYAHVPIILGPNKGKLSKRDGAVGILEYRKLGYLPEALINFMVFLGWNPKNEHELFTLTKFIEDLGLEDREDGVRKLEEEFDTKNVNKAGAVFDIDKLNHYNKYYMGRSDNDRIYSLLDNQTKDLIDKYDRKLPDGQTVKQVILSDVKVRIYHLSEFYDAIKFLAETPRLDRNDLIFKKSDREKTLAALKQAVSDLEILENSQWHYGGIDPIVSVFRKIGESDNFSNGDIYWPVRYALTGLKASPPPEMVATWLGKEESINRIKKAISLLEG